MQTILLVVAVLLTAVLPAQATECPLPEGVEPLADPPVTAQQVEDGSASLTDFALAVRAVYTKDPPISTVTELLYFACLFQQESGPWRAGSTYVVRQVPLPRVFIHAEDQSLSGRTVKRKIYDSILRALDIDPAVLTDPDALQVAFEAAKNGPGALFDVPSIPGASGYAIPILSEVSGLATLITVGFDLEAHHLDPVQLTHVEPPVTAEEVVDRESLKTFVNAAAEYYVDLAGSGDGEGINNARVIFRDENGPWKHGSVYVAFIQYHSGFIVLHGGFPDRFEMRQVGITRHIVTGELTIDQIYRAVESSPEGGFWDYYFDNPVDDLADFSVPKVGFARLFSVPFPRPDGSTLALDYIVHAGFYPDPTTLAAQQRGALENPSPDSSQSGVGALWGWVCDAELVEIEVETEQGEVSFTRAAYGSERRDTLEVCDHTDTGFVLLKNWNSYGAGTHTVTAFADRVELGQATVHVTTLGEGESEEFLRDVEGECVVEDFPYQGKSVALEWDQPSQNFMITDVR